jgi:hypothetical protein
MEQFFGSPGLAKVFALLSSVLVVGAPLILSLGQLTVPEKKFAPARVSRGALIAPYRTGRDLLIPSPPPLAARTNLNRD